MLPGGTAKRKPAKKRKVTHKVAPTRSDAAQRTGARTTPVRTTRSDAAQRVGAQTVTPAKTRAKSVRAQAKSYASQGQAVRKVAHVQRRRGVGVPSGGPGLTTRKEARDRGQLQLAARILQTRQTRAATRRAVTRPSTPQTAKLALTRVSTAQQGPNAQWALAIKAQGRLNQIAHVSPRTYEAKADQTRLRSARAQGRAYQNAPTEAKPIAPIQRKINRAALRPEVKSTLLNQAAQDPKVAQRAFSSGRLTKQEIGAARRAFLKAHPEERRERSPLRADIVRAAPKVAKAVGYVASGEARRDVERKAGAAVRKGAREGAETALRQGVAGALPGPVGTVTQAALKGIAGTVGAAAQASDSATVKKAAKVTKAASKVAGTETATSRGQKSVDVAVSQLPKKYRANAQAPARQILDLVSRANYTLANASKQAVRNIQRGDSLTKDLAQEAWDGLSGKDKTYFSDTLKQAGVRNPFVAGAAGFLLDVGLDPTTYLTGGTVSVGRKIAMKEAARAGAHAATMALAKGGSKAEAKHAAAVASRRSMVKSRRDLEKLRVSDPKAATRLDRKGAELRFGGHRGPRVKVTSKGARATRGGQTLVGPSVTGRVAEGTRGVQAKAHLAGDETRVGRGRAAVRGTLGEASSMVRKPGVTPRQWEDAQIAARSARVKGEATRRRGAQQGAFVNAVTRPSERHRIARALDEGTDAIEALKGTSKPMAAASRILPLTKGGERARIPWEPKRRAKVKELLDSEDREYKIAKALEQGFGETYQILKDLGVEMGYRKGRSTVRVPHAGLNLAQEEKAAAKTAVSRAQAAIPAEREATIKAAEAAGVARGEARILSQSSKQRETRLISNRRARGDKVADEGRRLLAEAERHRPGSKVALDKTQRAMNRLAEAVDHHHAADQAEAALKRSEGTTPHRAMEKLGKAERNRLERETLSTPKRPPTPSELDARRKAKNRRRAAVRRQATGSKEVRDRAVQTIAEADAIIARVDAKESSFKAGGKTQAPNLRRSNTSERLEAEAAAASERLAQAKGTVKGARKAVRKAERYNVKASREAGGYFPRIGIEAAEGSRAARLALGREGAAERTIGVVEPQTTRMGEAQGSFTKKRKRTESLAEIEKTDPDYVKNVSHDVGNVTRLYHAMAGRIETDAEATRALMRMGRKPGTEAPKGGEKVYMRQGHRLVLVHSPSEAARALRGEIQGEYRIIHPDLVSTVQPQRYYPDSKARRAWSQVHGAWKFTALANPGYLVRNAVSDAFAAYNVQSPGQLAKNYLKAIGGLNNMRRADRDAMHMADSLKRKGYGSTVMVKGKPMPIRDATYLAVAVGAINGGRVREAADLIDAGAVSFRGARGPGWWDRTVQRVEDTGRLATFFGGLDRGLSPERAAAFSNRIHFDYGALSATEQKLRSGAVPFYTFTSRNIPRQIHALLQRPGKLGNYAKFQGEMARAFGVDPEEIEGMGAVEQRALGIPFKFKGSTYWMSSQMPFTDLNAILPTDLTRPGAWLKMPVFGLGQKGLEMTGPFKLVAELITGYSFFYRDQIGRTTGESHLTKAPSWGSKLLDSMPGLAKAIHAQKIVDTKSPDGQMVWAWNDKLDYAARNSIPGVIAILNRSSYKGENTRGYSPLRELIGSLGLRITRKDDLVRERTMLYDLKDSLEAQRDAITKAGRTKENNKLTPADERVWQGLSYVGERLEEIAAGTNPSRNKPAPPASEAAPIDPWSEGAGGSEPLSKTEITRRRDARVRRGAGYPSKRKPKAKKSERVNLWAAP